MPFCRRCGVNNPAGSHFCEGCGAARDQTYPGQAVGAAAERGEGLEQIAWEVEADSVVARVAFSPEGGALAVGLEDGRLLLYGHPQNFAESSPSPGGPLRQEP